MSTPEAGGVAATGRERAVARERPPWSWARVFSVIFGGGAFLASCLVLLAAVATGVFGFALAYAIGTACVGLTAVLADRRWRWLRVAGLATLLAAGTLRASQLNQAGTLRVITLPGPGPTRWVDCLVPEREGTLIAAALLGLRDGGQDLAPLLHTAYERMDATLGAVPTPAIATYLGLQSPERFDAVVIEPQGPEPARSALIFLHGYAGNFNVYCWHLARAAQATHTLVVCPSVGPRGDHWTRRGLRTTQAALAYVHGRGIRQVVLGGLSNGAVGAGVIARTLVHDLDGVLLISGTPSTPPAPLPLLVLHGTRDGMSSPRRARGYAAAAGTRATHVALEGGHFVFLSQHERVTAAISGWLSRIYSGRG